jgi:tRNA(Ile)-lysidine synthase
MTSRSSPASPSRIHPVPAPRGRLDGPWDALARKLPVLSAGQTVACAFSGGLDSAALLTCAALAYGPAHVVAIHVNHGLQEAASDFEAFCIARAQALGVELKILPVDAHARPGQSPEEAARDARMIALANATIESGAPSCLLAHHGDDQAETVMLALARGLGLLGLSGMPASMERHGARFERPWLGISRSEIAAAAQGASMDWVEDPTNTDERFTRNLARAQVMPNIKEAFPGFNASASRSMAHCAQAQALLDEVAAEDLVRLARPDGALELAPIRSLSAPRLSNLLRHWLKHVHGAYASQSQCDEALLQIAASATGGAIDIKCGTGKLSRQGKALRFLDQPSHKPTAPHALKI